MYLSVSIALFCAGCAAPRLTPITYEKFEPHATSQAEVYSALGTPTGVMNNQWYYAGKGGKGGCVLEFDSSGYMVRKQWISEQEKRNEVAIPGLKDK